MEKQKRLSPRPIRPNFPLGTLRRMPGIGGGRTGGGFGAFDTAEVDAADVVGTAEAAF